ncbi:MAG: hypothetical protein ABI036_08075, partial [Fibrobacteria bacterium]
MIRILVMALFGRQGWEGRKPPLYKAAAAIAFCLALLSQTGVHAALGDLPVTNTVQSISSVNLNFGTAGSHQQLGLFLINSNDVTGFHITFTFQNKGFFKSGTRQFAMTNLVLNKISGTYGWGAGAEPVNVAITLDGAGSWTWTPGGVPSAETDAFLVEIAADWADQSSGIAGFYMEKVTPVIVSGP